MRAEELRKRIAEGEGSLQEFKRSLEKVDRTMVAFANARGGIIYLGVDDNGNFSGLRITNRLKAEIQSSARNLDPPIEVTCVDLGQALAVIVKEGEEKPYRCADGFYLRSGAANQKLTRDEILDLAVRVNRVRFEGLQVPEFHYPKEFSEAAFRAFVASAQLENALQSLGKAGFLISLGVAEQQGNRLLFNHAGVLVFGESPQFHLVQAKTSYARYRGRDKGTIVDRAIFTGPLTRQLEESLAKLRAQVPVRYQLTGSGARIETPAYPLRALEEGLVNALIHRDYSEAGAEVVIDHYDDRIEITNPGGLLGSLTVDSMKGKSRRRNPLLAEFLFRVGRGEKLGSGIGRMQALMDEWKLLPPHFEVTEDSFSVTFHGPAGYPQEERLLLLPERPRAFLEMMNKVPSPFSAQAYADRFAVNLRTAQKDLGLLVEQRLVAREGQGKNTRYRFL